MAKKGAKQAGYILYVHQEKPASECAAIVEVTEKTFGKWVKEGGWKEERNARENAINKRIDNIKGVIDDIVEDRASARLRLNELNTELKEAVAKKDTDKAAISKSMISDIKKEIVGYDDAISKWNKTLENFDKQNKISLSSYLHVMDEIFKDLQAFDKAIYMQTIDFQEQHINKVSIQIG